MINSKNIFAIVALAVVTLSPLARADAATKVRPNRHNKSNPTYVLPITTPKYDTKYCMTSGEVCVNLRA